MTLTLVAQEREPDTSTWQGKAACRSCPPSWFFPVQPGGYGRKTGAAAQAAITKAQAICARCPVREECYDYAVYNNEGDGIWGGVLFRWGRPQGLRPTNGRAY